MQLTPSQQSVIDAIDAGRNVSISGPAGTGKSITIEAISGGARCSFTGAAAVLVGGCTLHSFLSLGIGYEPGMRWQDMLRQMRADGIQRVVSCDRLIIDEVSMIDGRWLDAIDETFRHLRFAHLPFGGTQVIFSGDFLQLLPWGKGTQLAFESKAWQTADIEQHQLTEVLRQDDDSFINCLHQIRRGDAAGLDPLMSRVGAKPPEGIEPISLFPKNAEADKRNEERLEALSGDPVTYYAHDAGDGMALSKMPMPQTLTLKEGARVIYLRNDRDLDLVNGSAGSVVSCNSDSVTVDFDQQGIIRVERSQQDVIKGIREACSLHPSPRLANDDTHCCRCSGPPPSKKSILNVVASRLQLPLRPGYALSIHRSQGVTVDHCSVDLSQCWASGHVYTALSRVRSKEGLYIESLPRRINVDARCVAFYNTNTTTSTSNTMSRSDATLSQTGNGPANPAKKFLDLRKGELGYYNKDTKTRVPVNPPFSFICLDDLTTITGWHDGRSEGIYSNEVRGISGELKVRTRSGDLVTGSYSDCKEQIKAAGGRYTTSVYAAAKGDDGTLELVNLKFAGASLSAWLEFQGEHDLLNSNLAAVLTGFKEGHKGSVTYKIPEFQARPISDESNEAATDLDRELQKYLTLYFNQGKVPLSADSGADVSRRKVAAPSLVDDDDDEEIPMGDAATPVDISSPF